MLLQASEFGLQRLEGGAEHVEYEPLCTDHESVHIDAISFAVERPFVQHKHDVEHAPIANVVQVGSDQRPKLEALVGLFEHLCRIANKRQGKQNVPWLCSGLLEVQPLAPIL